MLKFQVEFISNNWKGVDSDPISYTGVAIRVLVTIAALLIYIILLWMTFNKI